MYYFDKFTLIVTVITFAPEQLTKIYSTAVLKQFQSDLGETDHVLTLTQTYSRKLFRQYQSDIEQADSQCVLETNTERIQLALVIDITWTHKTFMEVFREKFDLLMANLNKIHPDVEVAITGHANFPSDVFGYDQSVRWYPDKCYLVFANFTSNLKTLKEAVDRIPAHVLGAPGFIEPYQPLGGEENSFTAIAMTLSDPNIGWIRKSTDEKGRNIHRFVMLFTDVFNAWWFPYNETRRPFQADGTDTCMNTLPVSKTQFMKILRGMRVNMIGVYTNPENQNHIAAYHEFFKDHDFAECSLELDKGKKMNENMDDVETNIVSCVDNALECIYLDPPGYNTLGL